MSYEYNIRVKFFSSENGLLPPLPEIISNLYALFHYNNSSQTHVTPTVEGHGLWSMGRDVLF